MARHTKTRRPLLVTDDVVERIKLGYSESMPRTYFIGGGSSTEVRDTEVRDTEVRDRTEDGRTEDGRRWPAVSAGLDLPPLVVDRHPDDLAGLRGRLLLRWASAATGLLMYSATASAAHCERSRRSWRRLRKIPRRRRGMVRTT